MKTTLYRLLRALASVGVLREEDGRRFSLTPLGEQLRTDHPRSIHGWAALVGRPYVYALAVGGQEGVAAFLRQLGAETDVTLALIGASSVQELDASWIAASS